MECAAEEGGAGGDGRAGGGLPAPPAARVLHPRGRLRDAQGPRRIPQVRRVMFSFVSAFGLMHVHISIAMFWIYMYTYVCMEEISMDCR